SPALHQQERIGMPVRVDIYFPLKAFHYIGLIHRNGFACKIQALGQFKDVDFRKGLISRFKISVWRGSTFPLEFYPRNLIMDGEQVKEASKQNNNAEV